MIEILKKEINVLNYYIKFLKKAVKDKLYDSRTANNLIDDIEVRVSVLTIEYKKLRNADYKERQMKHLRKLAKKMKYKSVFQLQDDLITMKKQFTLKQIKKDYHPLVYQYFIKFKQNPLHAGGPVPPTLGRYPAEDDSARSKAIAGYKTFQQMPPTEDITVDIPDTPKKMKYLGELNHLVYFTSKWSRRDGIFSDMKDIKTVIPEHENTSYIHRWRVNKLHLLKHPDRDCYYTYGECQILDVGVDDFRVEDGEVSNLAPGFDFNYIIPTHIFEIGRLMELNFTTPEGENRTVHFDAETVRVCGDGEGQHQHLYLIKGKVKEVSEI